MDVSQFSNMAVLLLTCTDYLRVPPRKLELAADMDGCGHKCPPLTNVPECADGLRTGMLDLAVSRACCAADVTRHREPASTGSPTCAPYPSEVT